MKRTQWLHAVWAFAVLPALALANSTGRAIGQSAWLGPDVDSRAGSHLVVQWTIEPLGSRIRQFRGGVLLNEWSLDGVAIKHIQALPGNRFAGWFVSRLPWMEQDSNHGYTSLRVYQIRGHALEQAWSSGSHDEAWGLDEFELGVSDDGRFWFAFSAGPPAEAHVGELRTGGESWSWSGGNDDRFWQEVKPGPAILAVRAGRPVIVRAWDGAELLVVDPMRSAADLMPLPEACKAGLEPSNLLVTGTVAWLLCSIDGEFGVAAVPLDRSVAGVMTRASLGASGRGLRLLGSPVGALILDEGESRIVPLAFSAGSIRRDGEWKRLPPGPAWEHRREGLIELDEAGAVVNEVSWEDILSNRGSRIR